ncbi:hypothetical protein F5Y16DRAFT_384958 [Xylariaceae sp. FL0255]|nr:hypothetical protein F5Y16DRAFT_384958 [Xylariaceae sp. FL0255]
MMGVENIEYTLKQVAAHNSPTDAWMVIHGEVYDVTKYLENHPGGAEVLIDAAGKDASEDFDNAGHSEDAAEIMAEYRIGKLQGAKKKSAAAVRVSVEVPTSALKTSHNVLKTLARLGTTAILVVGAAGLYRAADQRGLLNSLPRNPFSRSRTSGLGFIEGILVTSAIFGVVGTVISRRMLKLLHSYPSFVNYPSRMRMPKRAKPDILGRADGWLHPTTFQDLPLVKKDLIAPNTYRLVFALPSTEAVLGLPTGQHVAITATVNGEAVTRSYTPVSNNSDKGVLELVVKSYADGKLTGGYLSQLTVGDDVRFRGPKGAMRYRRHLCRRIGMLAGGSGITPMYQVIRAICEDERDLTDVSLIYANRSEADILLREELETLARRYPQNLKVHYMLDQPPAEGWTGGVGYVTRDVLAERFPAADAESKVMLCGPPGMVIAAKKSLASLGFEQPGAMSKMSDQIFCF